MTYCPIRNFHGVGNDEHQRDDRMRVDNDAIITTTAPLSQNNKIIMTTCCQLHHPDGASFATTTCGKGESMDIVSSCCSLPPLPQEQQELNKNSTANFCPFLQQADIPISINKIGWMAFHQFNSLVQVSFSSASRIREISSCAFMDCNSLLVVSLPDSIERISYGAFGSCVNLTTVANMPTKGTLRIKAFAFRKCESLSNIDVTRSSNVVIDQRAFEGCTRLQECLGSLMGRYEGLPIHKLCYQNATTSTEEFSKALCTEQDPSPMVDMFGMTPFHVLSSSANPRIDWFQLLLKRYPHWILGLKDANGKRAMDYLAMNFTPNTKFLLGMALQAWMLDPLERWGASTKRSISMKDQVNDILAHQNMANRVDLLDKACSQMEDHERNERMTILELAVWKTELNEDTISQEEQRATALNICGSCCVLSNVAPFLGIVADPSTMIC